MDLGAIDFKKLAVRVLIIVVAVLALLIFGFVAIKLSTGLTFLTIWSIIVGQLVNYGFNIWLARAIAIIIAAALTYAINLMFSSDFKKRKLGIIMTCNIAVIYCLGLYLLTKDYIINPSTGKPAVCCATTPYGFEKVPCTWKKHPIFMTDVSPCTSEVILSDTMAKKGYPKVETIRPRKDMAFFTPDGQPLAWYYEYPDGKIEIFGRPGRHPQNNAVLNPINPEIVTKIFQQLQSETKTGVIIHEESGNNQMPNMQYLKELSDSLQDLQGNK
ncbi:hypothetical protein JW977_00385 [Candidatus Falkowbacteria bacterium]|nr:hypothetical protein [Candidatus Falkowbacteria bacterium]